MPMQKSCLTQPIIWIKPSFFANINAFKNAIETVTISSIDYFIAVYAQ